MERPMLLLLLFICFLIHNPFLILISEVNDRLYVCMYVGKLVDRYFVYLNIYCMYFGF